MIPFDFEYHRPKTVEEAAHVFQELRQDGRRPMYYGGGTEILTMARLWQTDPGAVVDIKEIADCRVLEGEGGDLALGAALTLAEICEANPWPFLSAAAGRVADHTTRCQITLGGNIAGQIQYREAALPLMLTDCRAVAAGPSGSREVAFNQVFDGALHLDEGEFLVQIKVPRAALEGRFASRKRTRLDWVDYPLVTVAVLERGDGVQVAVSGHCDRPFRSRPLEEELGGEGSRADRVRRALSHVPSAPVSDVHGSSAYRELVLASTLEEILEELGR